MQPPPPPPQISSMIQLAEGGFSCYLTDNGGSFGHPQSNELKPYYILLEAGCRARPPGPEPQLEDSYSDYKQR